jgi:hypothetical protein
MGEPPFTPGAEGHTRTHIPSSCLPCGLQSILGLSIAIMTEPKMMFSIMKSGAILAAPEEPSLGQSLTRHSMPQGWGADTPSLVRF